MIRSWAELEAHLESGGRLRCERREDGDAWRTEAPERDVVAVLATRALADGVLQKVKSEDDAIIYAWKAA